MLGRMSIPSSARGCATLSGPKPRVPACPGVPGRHDERVAQGGGERRALFARCSPEPWVKLQYRASPVGTTEIARDVSPARSGVLRTQPMFVGN